MSALLALGLSHKITPVDIRERVSLTEGQVVSVLDRLTASDDIQEAVALSTCNRTELYLVTGRPVGAEGEALNALAEHAQLSPTELADHLYVLHEIDVARHLFQVVAGLDSMIVGEAEIQGQVKRAYELALVEGATGMLSNRLFRDALAAGKRARTETGISKIKRSVSSVAVELAGELLGDLSKQRVLVVGAGKTGKLTARALVNRGVETIYVANRHYDRAKNLAQRFGGSALRMDKLPEELLQADIVVSGTSSPHKIVDHEELAILMGERKDKPLLIIDTAVPRDIDPAVKSLPGIHLYDMDDLQHLVEHRVPDDRVEILRAETIIEGDMESFERWLSGLEVLPTITSLRETAQHLVDRTLADNSSRWEGLTESDRERLEQMAQALVKRLLHEPTVRLRQAVDEGMGHVYSEAVRELFGLDAISEDRTENLDQGDNPKQPKATGSGNRL